MADNQQVETTNANVTGTVTTTADNKPSVTLESLQAELVSANKRIAELNKESEKHRKEADAIKAAKQAEEDAKKSEMEKLADKIAALTKEKEDAIQRANAKLIKAEILVKASKFIDGDVVYALLDKSKVTVNDDGSIEGVDALLDELAKAKPHLLKGKSPALDATNPGAGATNETREQKKARLTGASSDIFSGKGGGVVWAPGSFPEG